LNFFHLFSIGFRTKNAKVKLLGVTIDYELKFNSHITNICRKASKQLDVLKRMGKYLNTVFFQGVYNFI
jgi:hypothetical protein